MPPKQIRRRLQSLHGAERGKLRLNVSLSASANKVVDYIKTLQENNRLLPGATIKPKISKIWMKTLNEHWESMPISIDEATLKQGLRELIKEGFLEGAEN